MLRVRGSVKRLYAERYAACWPLAALIVILRVFAKLKIGQFRVDDILMILAMVCALFHFYIDYLSYSAPVSLSHIFLNYYVH